MKDNMPANISDQNNDVFKNIFKTLNAVMLLIDPEEGKIIDANNSASLFYGYSIEELCSMSIDQINTMPAEEIYNERIRAKEMKRNYFLFQHRLKNDEIRSVEVHSTPVNFGKKQILFSIIHDISSRVEATEKLKQSEEHFRALIEYSNDVISILDDKGNILYESQAHERVLGYRKGELIKKNVFEFVHPEDRERIKTQFAGLLKSPGETVSVNFRFKHKKGEFRFLEGAGTNLLNSDAVRGVVVNYRDVSDRKGSEQELIEQEKLLRTIAENYPNSYVSIIDNNLKVVFSSGMEFKNQNLDPEIFSGLSLEQIFGEHSGSVREHYQKTFKGEQQIFELHINGQDQLYKTVPLFSENGKIEKILVVVENITEGKRSEEKIMRIASEWQSTFDAISDSVSIIDLEGTILQYNIATLTMLGLNESEIKGKKCFELVHGLTDHYPDCPLVRVRESGKSESMEFEENGRWLKVTVDPIYSESGELSRCVHIVEDISENKKSEKLLIESKQFVESLVNLSPDILFIYDIEGKKNIYSNNGIERVLDYTTQQIKNMGDQIIPELMHPEDFKIYLRETVPRYATARDNESIEHQYRMKHQQGEWRWLSSREVIYSRNPDGTARQIFGVIQDITERKNGERFLRESEEKFRTLFRNMINGFAYHEIILDKTGSAVDYVFLEINGAFEKITGLKSDEIIGRRVTESIPGIEKDPANWIEIYGEVAVSGKELKLESFSKPLGKWFSIHAYSTKKGYFATIFEDITNRKKNEEIAVKYKNELEKKIEEKTGTLQEKISDLQRFFDAAVDRELRMKELYEENENLKSELKKTDNV